MSITPQQFRAARAFLGWSQRELAAKARVGRATIANFELGISTPQVRLWKPGGGLRRRRLVFLDADGRCARAKALRFKWGVMPPARQPGEDTATGEEGEGGLKAAWDDIEEDADLDALLGEAPAPDPDMAEYWRTAPELWASLSEGGRETLSRSMFGDCRAAGEGYFRGFETSLRS